MDSNIVDIPLLKVQREYLEATEKMVAIVSSRSCGKSFVACLHTLLTMLEGNNVVYFVQNLEAWSKGPKLHFYHFLTEMKLLDRWKWNGSTYTGTLQTQWGEAKFYLGTYGNPDAIRGATEVSLVTLDEFMLSSPEMLAAITPIMRGHNLRGELIHPMTRMVSTPNMSSSWQLMIIEHEKHGIRLLRSKMTDNVFISQEQRELMAKSIFDERLRQQEIEGEILLGDNSTSMCQLSDFKDQQTIMSASYPQVWAGLDMAHSGDRDRHVFCAIEDGCRLLALHEFGVCDSIDVAMWIKKFHTKHKISRLNMDLAWSESVFDQLKYEIACNQVPFGSAAEDKDSYANIRAEMYFRGARAIKEGLYVYTQNEFIDPKLVTELKREMTNIHFLQNLSNKLIIEPKSDIRIRVGHSPDVPDAFCLAAHLIPKFEPAMNNNANGYSQEYWDAVHDMMEDF